MNTIYDWMLGTWINKIVLGYAWSWPTLETLHFLGLCVLVGALLVMDLRLIGLQRIIPLKAVHSLMPVAIVAFGVNLITGLGFMFGNPYNYAGNWGFWAKMALVVLAGLNFLFYYYAVEPALVKLGPSDKTPALAKVVGMLSLTFWFGVLAFGRLLPYLGSQGG